MKRNKFAQRVVISLMFLLTIQTYAYSQAPQGFSYQAVVRNAAGVPIANKTIGIRITLEDASHVAYYTETQSKPTNEQGAFSITIGNGTVEGNNLFENIPWSNGDIFLKVEVDPEGGTAYATLGNPTNLQAVPYALFAENAKEVVSQPTALDDDPIFVVKNKAGQIVFAVYQTGVRVFVEDTPVIKGARGGFAVGGLSQTKAGTSDEYLRITSDSARIYVKTPIGKGARGGFAVGGLSQTKSTADNYMQLTPENYFIGHKSGFNNLTGTKNIFLGYETGYNNYGGTNNILVGYQSGYSLYNGGFNILLGYQSGYSIQNGSDNIFIGYQSGLNSLTSGNMFIGYRAGYSSTLGNFNIFMGTNTAYWNTTGARNTFIGYTCGVKNSTGNQNTFYGFESGVLNETGSDNTFIGKGSGYHNASGTGNVFIGSETGQNVDGTGNIFIGYQAGSQGSATTMNNRLFIHNNSSSTPLIYGEFDNGKVKLNASVNIRDFMVLEPQSSSPANPTKGTVYFNGTDNKLYCWNGTTWMALY